MCTFDITVLIRPDGIIACCLNDANGSESVASIGDMQMTGYVNEGI